MAKKSAGLLVYRQAQGLEVFLVHPGGPFWMKKDVGAWTLPKGEIGENEGALHAAKREFTEETGFSVDGEFRPLGPVRQSGGKVVYAWAVEGDCDPAELRSNSFPMEWPPRSGKVSQFPEVDRGGWFPIGEARKRILPAQEKFLDQLIELLDGRTTSPTNRALIAGMRSSRNSTRG